MSDVEEDIERSRRVKTVLTKPELTAEVLARLRAYDGCEGLKKVALWPSYESPDCNWRISCISAYDAADPFAVGPASDALYEKMRLEFDMVIEHKWRIAIPDEHHERLLQKLNGITVEFGPTLAFGGQVLRHYFFAQRAEAEQLAEVFGVDVVEGLKV